MMYLQKGKNELKEYVKQSGVKAIGTLEDTMQKRVLGMLVLPKTICYILMLCAFLKAVSKTSD